MHLRWPLDERKYEYGDTLKAGKGCSGTYSREDCRDLGDQDSGWAEVWTGRM